MSTVRLGVLGAARILHDAVVVPAAAVPEVEVTAIAARDRDRAEATARAEGIPRVLDDYDALLADPDVDAVYIPTPAALHGAWMRRAIAAGKHVLCEKPFTADAAEAEEIAALADASGLVVMEAFHSQLHPSWARLRDLLTEGAVGEVVSAEADFCVDIPDRSDIRWQEDMGGGALMDLGVYPLRLLTHLFGTPTVRWAEAKDEDGVDAEILVQLDLPGGVQGTLRASMVETVHHRAVARVVGTTGTLTVHAPYAPQNGGRIELERDGVITVEPVDPTASYVWMLRAFAGAVLRGADPVSDADEAVRAMRVVDAAYRAAGMAPRRPAPLG
ncbi:Gfo/Idh/MocA family protein [Cellulomonas triticagri]|uniref:Gfo/Idh/MocA family oxidoreductase n=1 Tax=Cellulomonas triticagri TaxID=2483352 RepID=A0A3M2J7S5_9CELL|nr:Gfo/Idh/MocA family oxidoreductase [Cellulomonas triticagri]RMI06538.1 gfo/Idh/MocA family oxidoreductase [Cellulomonas triticagri]